MAIVAAGGAAALGAWAWSRLQRWKRKDPAELERARRLQVSRIGRIAAGKVVDVIETKDPNSWMVVYRYEVAGVTYEAAQDIAPFVGNRIEAGWLAGQIASVKYDPKKPTNSILACEEWCGIAKPEPAPGPETQQVQKASEAVGKK